jgi:hypothetical protein
MRAIEQNLDGHDFVAERKQKGQTLVEFALVALIFCDSIWPYRVRSGVMDLEHYRTSHQSRGAICCCGGTDSPTPKS